MTSGRVILYLLNLYLLSQASCRSSGHKRPMNLYPLEHRQIGMTSSSTRLPFRISASCFFPASILVRIKSSLLL